VSKAENFKGLSKQLNGIIYGISDPEI